MNVASLSAVREAAHLVDASVVADLLNEWDADDQRYQGGRRSSLSLRSVLIAWLTIAIEEQPLHLTRVAELMTSRLTPKAAEALGIPYTFAQVSTDAMYDRVHRATQRLIDTLDYEPLPTRQRRLLKGEWERAKADREKRADELGAKRERLFQFTNTLLRAQYDALPETARTDDVSLVVDATFLRAFGRGMSAKRFEKRRLDQTVPSEPDAGWYIRTKRGKDEDAIGKVSANVKGEVEPDSSADKARKSGWGWEYELVSIISNDVDRPRAVPHIVIGMNHHRPSVQTSVSAAQVFDDIRARGLGFHHVIGDQAYLPGAIADNLQNPLRRAGAKLVMSYAVSEDNRQANGEAAIQAEAHGAIMVEGAWYCPSLPKPLREAMKTFQQSIKADRANESLSPTERALRRIDHEALRDAQIAERRKWEMRAKENPDERGKVKLRCPASGPGRTLDCPLKPKQTAPLPKGAVPLPVLMPPKAPGEVCTNKVSTTFDLDDGGKYEQYYRYGSPEWQRNYTYGRQVIESYNASLKDDANGGVGDSARRRLRGTAAQTFLALLGVAATNSRRIHAWMAEHYDETEPAPAATERRKRAPRLAPAAPRRRSRKGVPASRTARYQTSGAPPGVPALV